MGWVQKRTARGATGKVHWRAATRDPSGRVRSKTFARKVDADRWVIEQESGKARGSWVDPAGGRQTFGDYAAAWVASQVHRPTTAALVDSHLRRHVLPTFGSRPLAQVRPSEVQAWVKALSGKLAPATVEVVYRYVAAIFRAAVGDRLIGETPCRGVKLPKVERQKVVPLSTEQVEALVDAVPDRYAALVVVAAGTGLRQGELLGLTLDHVDFLRRTLRVERQLVTLGAGEPYLAPPKTDASRRAVPLPNVVVEALARHVEKYPPGPDGLIFTNDHGDPIRRNRFGQVWARAVQVAGLPKGTGCHDLRHYYASLLIRHGESVKVVQERLGHASATETLDTYSHLWPDSEDRTRLAVDSVLGVASGQQMGSTRTAGDHK